MYTFLNNSFTEGSDILKDDTMHLITTVLCNNENSVLKGFIDFVTGSGQKTIEKQDFIKI
jgi:hypothetical protein